MYGFNYHTKGGADFYGSVQNTTYSADSFLYNNGFLSSSNKPYFFLSVTISLCFLKVGYFLSILSWRLCSGSLLYISWLLTNFSFARDTNN